MGKTTRTFSKEVWACDLCGAEMDYAGLWLCYRCAKEICLSCQVTYEFTLMRWKHFGGHSYNILPDNLHKEGEKMCCCDACAKQLEGELVKLGFRSFSYDVKAV